MARLEIFLALTIVNCGVLISALHLKLNTEHAFRDEQNYAPNSAISTRKSIPDTEDTVALNTLDKSGKNDQLDVLKDAAKPNKKAAAGYVRSKRLWLYPMFRSALEDLHHFSMERNYIPADVYHSYYDHHPVYHHNYHWIRRRDASPHGHMSSGLHIDFRGESHNGGHHYGGHHGGHFGGHHGGHFGGHHVGHYGGHHGGGYHGGGHHFGHHDYYMDHHHGHMYR